MERTANLATLLDGDHGQRLREIGDRIGIAMDQLIDAEPRPDPAAWLGERGWAVTGHPVAAIAEHYGRDLRNPGLPRPKGFPAAAPDSQPAAGPNPVISFRCARR